MCTEEERTLVEALYEDGINGKSQWHVGRGGAELVEILIIVISESYNGDNLLFLPHRPICIESSPTQVGIDTVYHTMVCHEWKVNASPDHEHARTPFGS